MDTNNKEYTHLWMSKIEEKGYNQENSQIYRDLWCDYCMLFGNPSDAINAYLISVDEHPYSINHWNGLTRCYLAQNNINIKMIDQGSCELNIIIGVENRDFETAIRAIYDEFVLKQA